MKRIIAVTLFLAFSSTAFAQAPENKWRSPFTSAPGLTGISPLDQVKNHEIMEKERAEFAARKTEPKTAQGDRPQFLTSPAQLGRSK